MPQVRHPPARRLLLQPDPLQRRPAPTANRRARTRSTTTRRSACPTTIGQSGPAVHLPPDDSDGNARHGLPLHQRVRAPSGGPPGDDPRADARRRSTSHPKPGHPASASDILPATAAEEPMPETTSNVEFAHKIHEQGHHGGGPHGRAEWLEVIEAVVLAAVAVLTAWSGYQAAQWDARSAASYAQAVAAPPPRPRSSRRWPARSTSTTSALSTPGWRRIDTATSALAEVFERRFRPEYARRLRRVDEDRPDARSRKRRPARASCPSTTMPASRRRAPSRRRRRRNTERGVATGRRATTTSASPSSSPPSCC